LRVKEKIVKLAEKERKEKEEKEKLSGEIADCQEDVQQRVGSP